MVDLNCDLGEGVGNDLELMPFLSSCNISCGAHAGDETDIRTAIRAAKEHGIKIGAHPSYPDRENFGRKVIEMETKDLENSLKEQMAFFRQILDEEKAELHHLKPHGALYNHAVKDEPTAEIIVDLIRSSFPEVILYTQHGGVLATLAENAGIKVWYEGFADRNYAANLTLLPRSHQEALILRPEDIITHITPIIRDQQVKTIDGKLRDIKVDTLCIHGDNPRALEIAKQVRSHFAEFK
jgi:5-oxoprolinase (ATP-hydrolysing) subunit A